MLSNAQINTKLTPVTEYQLLKFVKSAKHLSLFKIFSLFNGGFKKQRINVQVHRQNDVCLKYIKDYMIYKPEGSNYPCLDVW